MFFLCLSYAHENRYILVGQNNCQGCTKTAFILDLRGDNLEHQLQISDNGEVYLKVDKIIAFSEKELSQCANQQGLSVNFDDFMSTTEIQSLINAKFGCPDPLTPCRYCGYCLYPTARSCPRCSQPQ
jgi:hypothetical protein